MTIERISGVTPNNFNKKVNFEKNNSIKINDSVSISANAKEMQKKFENTEINGVKELRNSSVVRKIKVEAAKVNLKEYFNDGELSLEIREKLADKIAESLLI